MRARGPPADRIPRTLRATRGSLTLTAVALSALVFLSATASAVPTTSVVLAAPYKGSAATVAESASPLGPAPCTAAKIPTPSYWHVKTGRLGATAFAQVRSSKNCSAPSITYNGQSATATATVSVSIPIGKPATTGYYSVVVNWTTVDTVAWNISHAACPAVNLSAHVSYVTCEAKTAVTVAPPNYPYNYYAAELVDLSTGGVVAYGSTGLPTQQNLSEWYRYASCSNAQSCTWTNITAGPTVGNLSTNLTSNTTWRSQWLAANHRYALEFSVEVIATVTVYTTVAGWDARAVASADLGSGANGFFVRSVTIA